MSDIEVLVLPKGVSIDNEQFPKYAEIVHQLYKVSDEPKLCRKIYNKCAKRNDIHVSKVNLRYVYKKMIDLKVISSKQSLFIFLQKKPIRNLSGLAVITVVMSPKPDGQDFTCKSDCAYCPKYPNMPRSYIPDETAVQRAVQNNWSAKDQTLSRLQNLEDQGHEISKLEIITEGGTVCHYPKSYIERFMRDIYYAANIFSSKETRKPYTISQEMQINNNYARCKVIGLSVETRPDEASKKWLLFFRHLGVTKIQFGVQHTDNTILRKIKRGHTFEQAENGIKRAMDNGYKVCIHLMPDNYGSSPEKDKAMFDRIFNESDMYPDEMKIYPTSVTPYTEIQKLYNEGKFMPYTDISPELLIDVLVYALVDCCKEWCRVARVIRDIPSTHIEGGNATTNLRQMVDERIRQLGLYSNDIRYKEVGRNTTTREKKYFVNQYSPHDYFISCQSEDKKVIYGFIRLRIPDPLTHTPIWSVLKNRGMIRELHVYGKQVAVHDAVKDKEQKQHQGIGTRLVNMAEDIARQRGCIGMSVISGEGVRNYYREKHGYHYDDSTFEIKNFEVSIEKKIKNNYWLAIMFIYALLICYIIPTITKTGDGIIETPSVEL